MTKVAFFGTSDRSIPILKALKQNFDLVLCVTKADVLVGRHKTSKETQVKKWAGENHINCIFIKNSMNEEGRDIATQIVSSKAEVGVVADFGYIIPQEILKVFPKGLINIHFSLLPKYRGASPVQFALLNGDKETGITYQLMEFTLDTGPIIEQIPCPLSEAKTSGELYKNLFNISAEKLPQILKKYLDGQLKPKPQDETRATYTFSPNHPNNTFIYKEDAKIAWTDPVDKIEAAVRAFHPWPIAWTTLLELQNARDKIAGFTQIKDIRQLPKTVKIHSAQVTIDGRLKILQIQKEGGKILTWEQFKNGYLA